jgi:energy-coupling factor transport system substrate-specific component
MTWQLASFVVVAAVLALGFGWYEHSRPPAKVLALVAALAALATVGRIAFAPIPNVKPTSDIALFAGYALGPVPGFAVGAIAALASNVFFGQGPWTPWQMLGWGIAGVLGGVLAAVAGRDLGRIPLAAACAFAGAVFGALLDLYQWTQGATHDLPAYLAWSATSLPYNLAHVMGNIVFCLLLGPTFVHSLTRFRRRFEVRWAPPAAAAVALALAVAGFAAAPQRADASAKSRAVGYLKGSQNSDGGFGPSPGASSTQLHTGWAALGLAAIGTNPADVHKGDSSVLDYMRAHASQLHDVGDIERTVLTFAAMRVSARSFGGRNLVRALERRRSHNGSWKQNTTWTSFGVLALKATGGSGVKHSARWLARQHNRDGGFGFRPHATSTIDDTGAALEALGAAGMRGTKVAGRAVRWLKRSQNRDGGFGQMRGQTSNSQSTAWAVQGLVGVGRNPAKVRRRGHSPLGYLRSLQLGDGSIPYSRMSHQTPVWTTAEALDALALKAFPLRAAKRPASGGSGSSSGGGGGSGAGAAGAGGGGATKGGKRFTPKGKPEAGAPSPGGTPAPTATPTTPTALTTRNTAAQAANEDGSDGGGFAWGAALAAGSLAAIAAFAAWRLLGRRGRFGG